jgi:hypothetical protein
MKKSLLIVLTFLLATLCSAGLYAESQAPKTFNEVQVFRGDPPGKPYKVVGEITLDVPAGMTQAQAVTLLKKQAFNEYEADAVINVTVTEKRTGGAPRRTVCPAGKAPCETTDTATFSENHAAGTAVKWK